MTLDPHTLLLMTISTIMVMAGVEMLVWNQDRRETALLWMAAAGLLGIGSMALRETLPATPAIVLANLVLLAGASSVTATCRALENRPPDWRVLLLPALAWTAGCAVPAFMASQPARVAVFSLICTFLAGWAIVELWHDRREQLRTRIVLQILLGIHGLAALARSGVAALSIGTSAPSRLVRAGDVPFVTFWVFGFLLLFSLGVILFVKERSERRLRMVADADPLTGLANRRHFERALDVALAQGFQSGRPVAVLMVDADAFKRYNDRYGHLAGDQALQEVGGVLTGTARAANGLAARYGGEEFAVLFPDADAAKALRLAEAMRGDVHARAIPHDDSPHGRVTISIGLTSRVPTEGVTARDYLLAADQALYAAKRAGRDQVRCGLDGGSASGAELQPDTATALPVSTRPA